MDDVGFEQLIVLPHIRNNGKDEPHTFFVVTVDARSQIRGQGLCREAQGCPRVDLYVGKFRDVPGGTKFSTRKLGVKFNDRALLGTVDVGTPLPGVIG